MAKYLRYKGEFLSVAGVVWRAEILQEADKAFSTIGALEFDAEEPLLIEWSARAKEEVICGATATLKIISPGDRTYEDLYSIEVGRVRLDVYRNGELYWSGCIDTEFYEEPYEQLNGYVVSLSFTDFGVLDRLKYNLTGLQTIDAVISHAINRSGIMVGGIDDSLISTLIPRNFPQQSDKPLKLSSLKVRSDNFYDEDGEALTLAEVVAGVLQPLGLKMIQRGGKVHVYDINALYNNGVRTLVEWSGDSQTMSVDAVYNNAKITWSTYAQSGNLLPDTCWPEDVDTPANTTALNYLNGLSSGDATYYSYHYSTDIIDWLDAEDCGFTLWTISRGNNITIHDERARYFRIVPQYDGGEAEGVVVRWRTLVGAGNASGAVCYESNYGITDYAGSAGAIGNPIFETPSVWLPPVDNPSSLLVRIKLEMLLDVRFNPFESATNIMAVGDEQDHTDSFKKNGNFVYVPVRIKFQPDGSDTVYTWSNTAMLLRPTSSPVKTMQATFGEWLTDAEDCGYLAYYDAADRKENCGVMGWQFNRPAINPHTAGLVSILEHAEDGQCIPYPTAGGGRLWVEIYNDGWRVIDGGEGFATGTNGKKSQFDHIKWILFKTPEIEILNNQQFEQEINTDDVEYSAELNSEAKDAIELETICGTSTEGVPTSRGAYFNAANGSQITKLIRAGRTSQAEDLLIGTLYSQYAQRRTKLSGEVELMTIPVAAYTEANQGDKIFMVVEDLQNTRADTSDATYVEIRPDEYKRSDE